MFDFLLMEKMKIWNFLVRNYLVVLTRIPIETMEDMIGLYLFSDEKKSSSYFFSIDPKTK
jgi:hypothetical protein